MYSRLLRIIHNETTAGVFLIGFSIIGLLLSNSDHSQDYENFLASQVFYGIDIHHSIAYWVNHALMAIFFLLIGLEVKEELIAGDLSSIQRALLPGFAAFGGMVVPAVLFLLVNYSHPENWRAWGTPVATDIAFSLAVLKLFGKRIPLSLKYVLLALASFDDIGAVVIIAIFYTASIDLVFLFVALAIYFFMGYCNYKRCGRITVYLLLGALLWWALSESGVDAALSGILIALMIPSQSPGSRALKLHATLGPLVNLVVVPIFALVNVNIQFATFSAKAFVSPLALGVLIGLIIGKPLGVLGFSWLAIRSRLAKFPVGVNWYNFTGIAFICGIGFTIGFLISELAFVNPLRIVVDELKSAILIGSSISALLAMIWFLCMKEKK